MIRRRVSATDLRRLEAKRNASESISAPSTTSAKEQLLDRLLRPVMNAESVQRQAPPPSQERVRSLEQTVAMAEARLRDAQQTLRDRVSGVLPYPTFSLTPEHRKGVLKFDLSEIASARLMLKFAMISLTHERERLGDAQVHDGHPFRH